MTAPQLALGIFFGFAGVEVFKVVTAMAYENHKRKAMVRDLDQAATGFIDKMHEEMMAERAAAEAKTAKRRKPAAKKPVVTTPAIKKAVAKTPARKVAPAKKPVTKKGNK